MKTKKGFEKRLVKGVKIFLNKKKKAKKVCKRCQSFSKEEKRQYYREGNKNLFEDQK